jgi:hypothetical protein
VRCDRISTENWCLEGLSGGGFPQGSLASASLDGIDTTVPPFFDLNRASETTYLGRRHTTLGAMLWQGALPQGLSGGRARRRRMSASGSKAADSACFSAAQVASWAAAAARRSRLRVVSASRSRRIGSPVPEESCAATHSAGRRESTRSLDIGQEFMEPEGLRRALREEILGAGNGALLPFAWVN